MKFDFHKRVENGKQKMATSSVAICALIRDGEKALKRNMQFVDKLASLFNKAEIIIVENDSIDQTKSLLKEWKSRNPRLHLIMKDYGTQTISEGSGSHPKSKYFSKSRVEKMSFYRNQYLNFVRENLEPDYLIVIDLDVHSIDLEGIQSSFGFEGEWDAISSNGRKLTPRNLFKKFYFDTYALLREEEKLPMNYPQMLKNQKVFSNLKKGMELLKVRSAFNGLCIYPWNGVKSFSYEAQENDDEVVSCLCEHVNLHLKMEASGYDKHFINPSQIVEYEKIDLNYFFSRIKERL